MLNKFYALTYYIPDVAGLLSIIAAFSLYYLMKFDTSKEYDTKETEKSKIYREYWSDFITATAVFCIPTVIALMSIYSFLRVWKWWFTYA